MGELSRIGIALDSDLLKRFDRSIEKSGYTNRSEAFRDLIRDRLVRETDRRARCHRRGHRHPHLRPSCPRDHRKAD